MCVVCVCVCVAIVCVWRYVRKLAVCVLMCGVLYLPCMNVTLVLLTVAWHHTHNCVCVVCAGTIPRPVHKRDRVMYALDTGREDTVGGR